MVINIKTGFVIFMVTAAILFMSGQKTMAAKSRVVNAVITQNSGGTFRVDASVRHPDTGWDHYANNFQILDGAGNVLATRVLVHPHVNEQPFTRSQGGIVIPATIKKVFVRAKCSIDGDGVELFKLDVPGRN